MSLTINLLNNPIPFNYNEANKLKYEFIISGSVYSGTETHTLIDFDDFELGNNDDDETIYFPGNTKVEFQLTGTLEKFENILLEFKTKTTVVKIYKNDVKIFSGYVYQGDVSGLQYTRRITVKIIDQFKKLQEFEPSKNPLGYTLTDTVKITDLLLDLLTNETFFDDPYVEEIVSLVNLEAQVTVSSVLTTVTFTSFATKYARYFSPVAIHKTVLDVIKGILLSYGCIGIIGFDKKFYIVPRKYNACATYELGRENMAAEPEANIIPRRKGLALTVYGAFGTTPPEPFNLGNVTEDYEALTLLEAGGNMPQSGSTPLIVSLAYVGATVYNINMNSFRNKLPGGTYTERSSLWYIITMDIWNLIRYERRSYDVEIIGNYEDISFSKFYFFEDMTDRFYRLRKAVYNLKDRSVKASLIDASTSVIEAASSIVFDVVMQPHDPKVWVDGVLYGTSADIIPISGQKVVAYFDNFYASTSLTVKRYDGEEITIPSDQLSVYQTTRMYCLYVAICKPTFTVPEFIYPVQTDAKATWYLLATIQDQKITDPAYIYEMLLPRIKTNQRYFFWFGVVSKDATLFTKIGRYGAAIERGEDLS